VQPVTTLHLGIDMGGTNIKWTVVELGHEEPRLVSKGFVPTDRTNGERGVLAQLVEVARTASRASGSISSAGVGVPGLYDPEHGTTRVIINVPGKWAGVPVASGIRDAVGVPTRLVNDARAFTLAEHRLGAGRGAATLLGVTLGTGVGGGLVIGGRIYLGHDGTAGEFGHQTILPDGPPCNCGNRGCLEALARADAIVEACGQATVEQAVEAAQGGDQRARDGFAGAGRYLGIGVSNVAVLLTVDRIVIGGGVAAAGELLLDPIRAELHRRVHVTDTQRIEVVCAELGTWAGAIGAAIYGAEATLHR
jgi:glucokinase